MNWNNLKRNKCPICDSDLVEGGKNIICSNHEDCEFKISTPRMSEIVQSQVLKEIDYKEPDRSDWE